jgi:hypothetical protein
VQWRRFATRFLVTLALYERKALIRVHHRSNAMNFTMFDNQHGVFVPVSVDANGDPAPATGVTLTSSDPTIITVEGPDAGISSDFDITCQGKDGTVTLTVAGTNANGQAISTAFTFVVSAPTVANPAVGFTATLINVANN